LQAIQQPTQQSKARKLITQQPSKASQCYPASKQKNKLIMSPLTHIND
jgi:hypothetical protein